MIFDYICHYFLISLKQFFSSFVAFFDLYIIVFCIVAFNIFIIFLEKNFIFAIIYQYQFFVVDNYPFVYHNRVPNTLNIAPSSSTSRTRSLFVMNKIYIYISIPFLFLENYKNHHLFL